MNIDNLIYSMLTTNTGIHMLDSGGENGRAWQRNQKRTLKDFINEPEAELMYEPEEGETTEDNVVSVSTFHYLRRYELDSICDYFNSLECPDWDTEQDIYGVSDKQLDKFAEWLFPSGATFQDLIDAECIELDKPYNTYNGDCLLDQTLQGCRLTINGERYEFIQIHNGADVRGGYTDAKLFKLPEYAEWMSWDVVGTIDGVEVSTLDDGVNLVNYDTSEPVPLKPDSEVSLQIVEY